MRWPRPVTKEERVSDIGEYRKEMERELGKLSYRDILVSIKLDALQSQVWSALVVSYRCEHSIGEIACLEAQNQNVDL